MRLSPLDPMGYTSLIGIGAAHFVAGRYDDAIAWTQRGLSQHPEAIWGLRQLVTALAHAGRKGDARRECKKLMEGYPELNIRKVDDALPFGEDTMKRIVAGLREAGLPE
jgi:adenylate cyclase